MTSSGAQQVDPWDLMALCNQSVALQEYTNLLAGFSCASLSSFRQDIENGEWVSSSLSIVSRCKSSGIVGILV